MISIDTEYDTGKNRREVAGGWGDLSAYSGSRADISTAAGKAIKDAYRQEIGTLLNLYTGEDDLYRMNQDSGEIDNALPRSCTIEECIGLHTALRSMIDGTPSRVLERITVPELLDRFANNGQISKVIVARETGYAAYFTYAAAQSPGTIMTTAVLKSTNDVVFDLLRTLLCDFTDVGSALEQVILTADNISYGYVYMQIKHEVDRYKVIYIAPVRRDVVVEQRVTQWKSLPDLVQAISAALAGWKYAPTANENQSYVAGNRGRVVRAAPRHSYFKSPVEGIAGYERRGAQPTRYNHVYFSYGYRFFPTCSQAPYSPALFDVKSLFDGPSDLDIEYRTYCHRRAKPPITDYSTRFDRSMQIQERTGSLAGIIARRYSTGMHPDEFIANMQETSRLNEDPMDMDHTINAIASLSMRRGYGTYSSYIQVPRRAAEPRKPITAFWPLFEDTWLPLLKAYNLKGKLVPTGI